MASLRGVSGFEELRARSANPGLVGFWLRELRTPELLLEVVAAHREIARSAGRPRPAVEAALSDSPGDVAAALEASEREERHRDREYWAPLKRELEELRLGRSKGDRGGR